MKAVRAWRTFISTFSLAVLAACGGGSSGSDTPSPGGNPSSGGMPAAVFKSLPGTTTADAALGQPLTVEWNFPAGVAIAAVSLDAQVAAGPSGNQSDCTVDAGPLPATATSATITIPNTCASKTVKQVQLRLTIQNSAGQSATATRTFAAAAVPAEFQPQRVNLPVLRITTDNDAPIASRDVYVPGQVSLEPGDTAAAPVTSVMQIRGRGNSTWDLMPKKSYRLKLAEKHSLLGMPSSKDWVLLANHSDKTLLRNTLAMELGQQIGMTWTPRQAFVEVYHGARYLGVYLLIENIKVAKDRVDIDELEDTDVDASVISGGYLLEVDFRQDGHTIFTAVDQLPVVFQDPEEPAPEQEAFLSNYLDEFEAVLYSADFADPVTGYAAYIDVDSFARWFIVNEVFRNRDANMWSSCWMYKPRGGKLHMGPLWDFDISAGNINYDGAWETTGWWVHDAPWFSRLFEDPAFRARVKQIWNEAKATQLPAMLDSITTHATQLQQAQLNNFERWPILETYVWPNNRIPGSYAGELDYLRAWLGARIAWMDSQFNP